MKRISTLKSLALVAGMMLMGAGQAWAGNGTKESPYTVAELNAQKDALAASGNTVWVKADLKGLGEDGTKTENATEGSTKQMAGLFEDATGTFVAYSWQILGELALSDLTNTKDLLISLTYGTTGHPYGNSANPQYASNYEPTDAHFSLAEVHGALSLQIKNGYRGYHIASSYVVPKEIVAARVASNYNSNSKVASIAYGYYDGAEEGKTYIINKNTALVLLAYDGTYDFVLSSGYYEQINSNSLSGGANVGVNTIPMKNNQLRYHYRFVANGGKVGFERNSDTSTEVNLESKDEVYLTINGNDNHFFGNWTWETGDKKWISWTDKAISYFHEQPQQPTEVTFDFLNNNLNLPYGQQGTPSEVKAGDLSGKSITKDGVVLKFVSPATLPTRYYKNGDRGLQYQNQTGGQMRVTAPLGYAVTEIISKGNKSVNAKTGAITYQNSWTVNKGGGSLTSANQETQTWTGNAESVRLNSGTCYIEEFKVTIAPVNSETLLRADEVADNYTEVNGLTAFKDAANNTLVKLTLTDAIITSGMINEEGFYVQDATGGAHFYYTGLEFEIGDVLNGTIYVKKSTMTPGNRIVMTEETNVAGLTITKNGTVTPTEGTIAEINVAENNCRIVKLTGVKVKGTEETKATVTDDNNNEIIINNSKVNNYPYVIKETLATIDYTNATVVGILVATANSGNQIMPLSITGTANGISEINADFNAADVKIYNLQGVRLNQLQRGLNIVNGKKVVIK